MAPGPVIRFNCGEFRPGERPIIRTNSGGSSTVPKKHIPPPPPPPPRGPFPPTGGEEEQRWYCQRTNIMCPPTIGPNGELIPSREIRELRAVCIQCHLTIDGLGWAITPGSSFPNPECGYRSLAECGRFCRTVRFNCIDTPSKPEVCRNCISTYIFCPNQNPGQSPPSIPSRTGRPRDDAPTQFENENGYVFKLYQTVRTCVDCKCHSSVPGNSQDPPTVVFCDYEEPNADIRCNNECRTSTYPCPVINSRWYHCLTCTILCPGQTQVECARGGFGDPCVAGGPVRGLNGQYAVAFENKTCVQCSPAEYNDPLECCLFNSPDCGGDCNSIGYECPDCYYCVEVTITGNEPGQVIRRCLRVDCFDQTIPPRSSGIKYHSKQACGAACVSDDPSGSGEEDCLWWCDHNLGVCIEICDENDPRYADSGPRSVCLETCRREAPDAGEVTVGQRTSYNCLNDGTCELIYGVEGEFSTERECLDTCFYGYECNYRNNCIQLRGSKQTQEDCERICAPPPPPKWDCGQNYVKGLQISVCREINYGEPGYGPAPYTSLQQCQIHCLTSLTPPRYNCIPQRRGSTTAGSRCIPAHIEDGIPAWQAARFDTRQECIAAIGNGSPPCTIIDDSSYDCIISGGQGGGGSIVRSCVQRSTGGQFNTLEDCQQSCRSSLWHCMTRARVSEPCVIIENTEGGYILKQQCLENCQPIEDPEPVGSIFNPEQDPFQIPTAGQVPDPDPDPVRIGTENPIESSFLNLSNISKNPIVMIKSALDKIINLVKPKTKIVIDITSPELGGIIDSNNTTTSLYHQYYNFYSYKSNDHTTFVANNLYPLIFNSMIPAEVKYVLSYSNTNHPWSDYMLSNLTLDRVAASLKPEILGSSVRIQDYGNYNIGATNIITMIYNILISGKISEFDQMYFAKLELRQSEDATTELQIQSNGDSNDLLSRAALGLISDGVLSSDFRTYTDEYTSLQLRRQKRLNTEINTEISIIQDSGINGSIELDNVGRLEIMPSSIYNSQIESEALIMYTGEGAGSYFSGVTINNVDFAINTTNDLSGSVYIPPKLRYTVLKLLNKSPGCSLLVSSNSTGHELHPAYNPSADVGIMYFANNIDSITYANTDNDIVTKISGNYNMLSVEDAKIHSHTYALNTTVVNIDFRDPLIHYARDTSTLSLSQNDVTFRSFQSNKVFLDGGIITTNLPMAVILVPGCGVEHNPFYSNSKMSFISENISRSLDLIPDINTDSKDSNTPLLDELLLHEVLGTYYFGLYEKENYFDTRGLIYSYNPSSNYFNNSYYYNDAYSNVQPPSSMRTGSPESILVKLVTRLVNDYSPKELTWWDVFRRLSFSEIGNLFTLDTTDILDKLSNGLVGGIKIRKVLSRFGEIETGITVPLLESDIIYINLEDRINAKNS